MKRTSCYLRSIEAVLIIVFYCIASNTFAADTTFRSSAPFPFGASINVNLLKSNAIYRALVAREYSSLTAENAMKIAALHPGINTYNWSDADTLVNFAGTNSQRVHGHTLIWHQSLPGWVTGFSGDSLAWENLFRTHIQAIVGHFAGKVSSWDVVNEAFVDNGSLRPSPWLEHLGPGYIGRAFRYAHAADPVALLFYNDYGHEYSLPKLRAIDSLAHALLLEGVPLHGLGMQMHLNKNSSNNAIANAIRVMAQTRLRIHIAELDISLNPENNQALTLTPALAQQQADKYNYVTRLYKFLPTAQQYGITTWNVSDADSWIPTNYNRPDWPLPFDASYQRKPAYAAIIAAFTSTWNYDASATQSAAGAYTDLGSTGVAITKNYNGAPMSYDDDNSMAQEIGFPLLYNGTVYLQFILNSNGYIKLGNTAPSAPNIFYPAFNGNTNGVIAAADADMLYPYNHDLAGTPGTEYRVATTGNTGNRVCTIQYKAVADKLAPVQYASMHFQVKLYEGSNNIEFVFGDWTASSSASTLTTAALGIKGSFANNSVNLAKGSGTAWATTPAMANTLYFINGDYATAGPQFNTRNATLPDVGRTFRFTSLSQAVLPLVLTAFGVIEKNGLAALSWSSARENNTSHFELERAVDAAAFQRIGTIAATGVNAETTNYYHYTDRVMAASGGKIYYRLKITDKDGGYKYSRTITLLHVNGAMAWSVTAQSPFTRSVTVKIVSDRREKAQLALIDAAGAVVTKTEVTLQTGSNTISFDASASLRPAVYILQVYRGGEIKTVKVLRQ